jgi:hypothetical protein
MSIAALVAAFAFAPLGCQRDAETARALLRTQQASWERGLGSLKEQQAALKERFERQPPPPATAPGDVSPTAMRMRAILDGGRQSLVDIESQIRQVPDRLEPAMGRGPEVAEKALEQESARINDYLKSMSDQLALAGRELDGYGKSGAASKTGSKDN